MENTSSNFKYIFFYHFISKNSVISSVNSFVKKNLSSFWAKIVTFCSLSPCCLAQSEFPESTLRKKKKKKREGKLIADKTCGTFQR